MTLDHMTQDEKRAYWRESARRKRAKQRAEKGIELSVGAEPYVCA